MAERPLQRRSVGVYAYLEKVNGKWLARASLYGGEKNIYVSVSLLCVLASLPFYGNHPV